jgi:hypothetical protein
MSVGDNAIWFCSWRVSSLCSSVSRHSFSTSKFPLSSTSCERPCLLLIEVLPSPNRAGNTSGGLGGRHAPQNSWADTSPTKSFCRSLFLRGTAGEPTLALILPIRPHQALVRGPGRLLRDCINYHAINDGHPFQVVCAKFKERESRRPLICILVVGRGLPRIPSILPNVMYRQPLSWELSGTIRLLRQTPGGRQKKQGNNERFHTPTIYTQSDKKKTKK